jgi:hypothetical protein
MISELKVLLRKGKKSLKKKIERIQYQLNLFGGRKNPEALNFDPKTLPFLDHIIVLENKSLYIFLN